MKKIILISSVGGHLEQLLNLNEVIDRYDTHIITEINFSTLNLKEKYKSVSYLPYMSRKSYLLFTLNLIKNAFLSLYYLFKFRPNVIISTGSACTIFTCFFAKIMGKKVIFIETFSRIESKTITGKICYYIADVFVVQWHELLKIYPRAVYLGQIY